MSESQQHLESPATGWEESMQPLDTVASASAANGTCAGQAAVRVLVSVVQEELLQRVAGPAVARHMRRAAVDLMYDYDFLLSFRIGLDGGIHPPSSLPDDDHAVAGLGHWLGLVLDRVRALDPRIDADCVPRIAGPDADPLREFGFFDAVETSITEASRPLKSAAQ